MEILALSHTDIKESTNRNRKKYKININILKILKINKNIIIYYTKSYN